MKKKQPQQHKSCGNWGNSRISGGHDDNYSPRTCSCHKTRPMVGELAQFGNDRVQQVVMFRHWSCFGHCGQQPVAQLCLGALGMNPRRYWQPHWKHALPLLSLNQQYLHHPRWFWKIIPQLDLNLRNNKKFGRGITPGELGGWGINVMSGNPCKMEVVSALTWGLALSIWRYRNPFARIQGRMFLYNFLKNTTDVTELEIGTAKAPG